MIWILLACLLALALACILGALLQRFFRQRRARAAMVIRNPAGIVEERFVSIGGIDQWIGIRGEDRANPVLLLIHGGPGCSYSIFTPLLRSWEDHFTIVQWDQRGSGKTLSRSRAASRALSHELTIDRLISDGIEVGEYVRARLGKNRIILLASSFGSLFGLPMVLRRPDLFSAYVGTDQNVGIARDCESNHRATIARLRALGLRKGVALLEKIGPHPNRWTAEDFTSAARWTMKSEPRSCAQIMKLLKSAIWFSPYHTLRGIRDFVLGMKLSTRRLFPEARTHDPRQEGVTFPLPFFLLQGENDVLTPPGTARTFFDEVIAPVKRFALIENAGHFAAFVQPGQFLQALLSQVLPVILPLDHPDRPTPPDPAKVNSEAAARGPNGRAHATLLPHESLTDFHGSHSLFLGRGRNPDSHSAGRGHFPGRPAAQPAIRKRGSGCLEDSRTA